MPAPTTVAEVLDAVRRRGLELTSDHQELDGMGLDFLVVHARDAAGAPWIVRTPRRPDVVESARVEARVLALVAPRLPVAVPDWRIFAPDVIAYPRLEGTPAVTLDASGSPTWNLLDPSAPATPFLDSFADAVAALLRIPPEEARAAGVPSSSIDELRAALARDMEETRSALQPSDAVWARWHRWLDDEDLWPRHMALAHSDLHPGHMLLAGDARLVGILDWTEARVTDPSVDLAMFHGAFGRPALEAVVARLERAGVPLWPRVADHAAERWAAMPAMGAAWALRTGNDFALEHSRMHLRAQG